jgi:hypothetical protein
MINHLIHFDVAWRAHKEIESFLREKRDLMPKKICNKFIIRKTKSLLDSAKIY